MRNILLTVSYNGTNFCGWQRQDHKNQIKVRTIQGEIETALSKLLKEKITLYGSGRTDSGVHAQGQAANFFSPIESIPPQNYARVLNGMLPSDIRIMNSSEVSESFNSRFNATSRVYRYFIKPEHIPFATQTSFVWAVSQNPDVKKLNQMVACLRGEIDCTSFAAAGDQSKSMFRYIDNAFFFETEGFPEGKLLVFQIEANAFLWRMVRSITGSLIQFERENRSIDYFSQVLASKERKNAGTTAPPSGLFLWKVKFDGVRRHV